jgi:hypothetical protein
MVKSLNKVPSRHVRHLTYLTVLTCLTLLTFATGCATIEPWDAALLSKRNMQFREAAAFASSIEIVKQIETGRLGGRFGGPATACTACSR